MKFALGDNHDENNTQTANELVAGILDESVYAEEVYLGDIFPVVAGTAVIAAALLVKQVVYAAEGGYEDVKKWLCTTVAC